MPIPEAWPLALPTVRDFLVSPGFAGAAVLLAAIIVLCAVLYGSGRAARRVDKQLEQQDLHHQEVRADRAREDVLDRCWQRLVWLIETAGVEPAARDADEGSLGLGPELVFEFLQGLQRDAKGLGDDTLVRAVTVYLAQYGLVLGRHGGALPEIVAERDGEPSSSAGDKPSAAPTVGGGDSPATSEASARKGRPR